MCFSASASFTASAALFLCGIAALVRAKKNQYWFASIPLLFSMQQYIEGTVWQAIPHGTQTSLAIYAYLTFVFIIWPNWVPWSVYHLIVKKSEKNRLIFPMISGILISIVAGIYLMMHAPYAMIEQCHIVYRSHVPSLLWAPGSFFYLIATIVPFFISSNKHLRAMGIVLACSYAASLLFYFGALLSVWCFFSALLSIFVLIIVG